jgi:hypothetical protein
MPVACVYVRVCVHQARTSSAVLRCHGENGPDSAMLFVSAIGQSTLEVRRIRHGEGQELEHVFEERLYGKIWDMQASCSSLCRPRPKCSIPFLIIIHVCDDYFLFLSNLQVLPRASVPHTAWMHHNPTDAGTSKRHI